MSRSQIYYSDRYSDDQFEYRHVVLPREMAKYIPRSHLMSEEEWRQLGVQQSIGWIHYMIHEPGASLTSFCLEDLCLNIDHFNCNSSQQRTCITQQCFQWARTKNRTVVSSENYHAGLKS